MTSSRRQAPEPQRALAGNPGGGAPIPGFFTAGYPGIFFLGHGHPVVISSTIN